MTYLIRYAIAESGFMKSLILWRFAAYGIPNLNSLQLNRKTSSFTGLAGKPAALGLAEKPAVLGLQEKLFSLCCSTGFI